MKHEWKGGMTPSTPDSPPEGYCYCENCGVEQDDDNRDEECSIQCVTCGDTGEVMYESGSPIDIEPTQIPEPCPDCR